MKFELHCHSWYSKGRKIPWEGVTSPEQIFRVLKRKDFSGVAITDHDSVKSWKDARKLARKHGMVFIPGVEVSTKSGHVIGLGLSENVKKGMSVDSTVDEIRSQGGIAVAPHPLDLRSEGIGDEFVKCDAAEAFNSLNLSRIENNIARGRIMKAGMPAVGGSDAHSAGMLGLTANHIDADDADGVLRQIKKGRVRIEGSYTPIPVVVSWVRERMRLSYGDVLRYVGKNYPAPKAAVAKFFLRRFVNSESRLWDGLGYFSIGTSIAYSAFRTVF
jgi:predicted metal-dependent phosphoesterase TrpH